MAIIVTICVTVKHVIGRVQDGIASLVELEPNLLTLKSQKVTAGLIGLAH